MKNGRLSKCPAFQAYAADAISDEFLATATLAEEGAFWRLLNSAWINRGVPSDPDKLAKICRVSRREFNRVWPAIATAFVPWEASSRFPSRLPPGDSQTRLYNPRQERERDSQERHFERRKAASAIANGVLAKKRASESVPESATESDPSRSRTRSRIDTDAVSTLRTPPSAPRPKRPRKEPEGDHPDVVRHWVAEWARTRAGAEWQITPRDCSHFAAVLKHAPVEEVKLRITRLLDSTDSFYLRAATPGVLESNWNPLGIEVSAPRTPSFVDQGLANVRAVTEMFKRNGGAKELEA